VDGAADTLKQQKADTLFLLMIKSSSQKENIAQKTLARFWHDFLSQRLLLVPFCSAYPGTCF
jgi:hypothetical protein